MWPTRRKASASDALLGKLRARGWKTEAERDELLKAAGEATNLDAEDVGWMAVEPVHANGKQWRLAPGIALHARAASARDNTPLIERLLETARAARSRSWFRRDVPSWRCNT